MENSWKTHGIVFLNFCGNPEFIYPVWCSCISATDISARDILVTDISAKEKFRIITLERMLLQTK